MHQSSRRFLILLTQSGAVAVDPKPIQLIGYTEGRNDLPDGQFANWVTNRACIVQGRRHGTASPGRGTDEEAARLDAVRGMVARRQDGDHRLALGKPGERGVGTRTQDVPHDRRLALRYLPARPGHRQGHQPDGGRPRQHLQHRPVLTCPAERATASRR